MTREFPQVTMPEASQYLIRYSPDAKNSIEEINHLYKRLFKELYRISGGTSRHEHSIFFIRI